MTAFSDAMRAVRDVIVMQTRIDALTKELEQHAGEAKSMTKSIVEIDRRVSRLEGMIEGAAMATRQRRIEE